MRTTKDANKSVLRPPEWEDLDDLLELNEFLMVCCALERCFRLSRRWQIRAPTSMLSPPDKILPVIGGHEEFGTWRSLIFVETDVYRRGRTVVAQVLGE